MDVHQSLAEAGYGFGTALDAHGNRYTVCIHVLDNGIHVMVDMDLLALASDPVGMMREEIAAANVTVH